jgi:hypothetical protein
MPLQQALRVGETAVFLDMSGSGQKKDFRWNLLRPELAALHLGRVIPEGRGLKLDHVTHHQPFQFGQSLALQSRIRGSHGGVLPHNKQAFHLAVHHFQEIALVRMVTGNARKPVESPIIFLRRCFTVVGLQQTDDVLIEVPPPTGPIAIGRNVMRQIV